MNEKIKRFIECLIPITACNIKCSYCYVMQRDNRKMKMPKMKYSMDAIGKSLTKERWGGTCYFSICGAGETLIPHETIEIVHEILTNGHFVNITTNGTMSKRFDEILKFPSENLERLHFAFSFHYLELKRIKKLDTFFDNIKKVRKAGCSFVLQLNLCDEYIPYLDEIKRISIENTGAMPQVAATRKEKCLKNTVQLLTELSKEEYAKIGKSFESPLFDFTMQNFNVNRNEFCYAGDWTGTLDLSTGVFSRCYGSHIKQNIFRNPKKPIKFQAIGCKCQSLFCMNSSHFLSLGVIPSLETPTYEMLRNRRNANWYSKRMMDFLSGKLVSENNYYSDTQIKKSIIYAKKEDALKYLSSFRKGTISDFNLFRLIGRKKHEEEC